MRLLFVVTWLHPRGWGSRHAFTVAEGLEEPDHHMIGIP